MINPWVLHGLSLHYLFHPPYEDHILSSIFTPFVPYLGTQDLHETTVSKVEADFEKKREDRLADARKDIEEDCDPTEERKAYED